MVSLRAFCRPDTKNLIIRAFVYIVSWVNNGKYRLFFIPSYKSFMYLNLSEPLTIRRIFGQYERSKVEFLKRYLREGMVFIDVGASLGDFSIIASRLIGQSGRVVAYEPDPSNCLFLNKCVKKNKLKNVQIMEEALANKDGFASLYLGNVSGWHTLKKGKLDCEKGKINVKTRRLDSINLSRMDLMKIDVEGAEFDVIQGAERQIKKFSPVLLIDLHPLMGANIDGLMEFLYNFGYKIYGFDSQHKLRPYNENDTEVAALPKHKKELITNN